MQRTISLLGVLAFVGAIAIPAFAQSPLTINAVSFNYIAGTPDYTQGAGLVAGGSGTVLTEGIANVALPQGAVVKGFTVCGRDFASDQQFAGALKRKTINPVNSAFTAPQTMVAVSSGVTFAQDAMKCSHKTAISNATIDNTHWTYYVDIHIGFTVEVISVTIDY
jgi:hypothetical protein